MTCTGKALLPLLSPLFLLVLAGINCAPAMAQEKGNIEVMVLSGGFSFRSGGELVPVDRDFTGNVQVRPNVGYAYFLKKNVGLDFSVGYRMDANRASPYPFIQERSRAVDGQVGLVFIF